jgi:predicted O-methyltransferase YrrM
MSNSDFINKAFRISGPKFIKGFSRPLYHNIAGFFYGHQFDNKGYGGMLRSTEGAMLYLWARMLPENATIVEVGSYAGLSTSYLAKGCKDNNSKVIAMDPYDSDLEKQAERTDHEVLLEDKPSRQSVLNKLKAHGLGDRVELIEGYSQEVVKTWDSPIDFLWIDGNHDQAYQDYIDWSPFLTSKARVGLHDAHPRYGLSRVAEDARKIFSSDKWTNLEHVKGIITGVLKH